MLFECKKTENCFADSSTYEYRLPVTAAELGSRLGGWRVEENRRYRRPLLTAEKDGVVIKGILDSRVVKVSFQTEAEAREKAEFEKLLSGETENA